MHLCVRIADIPEEIRHEALSLGTRKGEHRLELDALTFQRLLAQAPQDGKMRGLGDLVARFAQPVAAIIDRVAGTKLKGCGGCKGRQARLNKAVPFKA